MSLASPVDLAKLVVGLRQRNLAPRDLLLSDCILVTPFIKLVKI